MSNKHKLDGLTLVEVLIVVAIAVIAATIAAPSFRIYLANSKANEVAYALATTFNRAKTEAITQATAISVCSLASPIPLNKNCSNFACNCGSASNWNNGWMIFNLNTGAKIPYNIQTPANTIQVNTGVFTFQANGLLAGSTTVFTIKPTGCSYGYSTTVFSPIGHIQICPNPNNPKCVKITCP